MPAIAAGRPCTAAMPAKAGTASKHIITNNSFFIPSILYNRLLCTSRFRPVNFHYDIAGRRAFCPVPLLAK